MQIGASSILAGGSNPIAGRRGECGYKTTVVAGLSKPWSSGSSPDIRSGVVSTYEDPESPGMGDSLLVRSRVERGRREIAMGCGFLPLGLRRHRRLEQIEQEIEECPS